MKIRKITMVLVAAIFSIGITTYGDNQKSCEVKTFAIPSLDMQFVYVSPGSFMMGAVDGNRDEKPVHKVTISNGYWIGKYEVTQKQYQEIMGKKTSRFKGDSKPVEMVSWNDAVEFCKKLTRREHKAGRLPEDCKYRLPTEAEWEFAARGGIKSKGYKYSGSNDIDSVAWCFNNCGDSKSSDSDWIRCRSKNDNCQLFNKFIKSNNCRTHKVGSLKSNELGIYDMSGNVYEWCHDWYANYSSNSVTDPSGAKKGTHRVFRGGSWYYRDLGCRVADRYYSIPENLYYHMGFRIVRTRSKNIRVK